MDNRFIPCWLTTVKLFALQRGEISRSDVSLSVESALESFDFLEDDFCGDSCSTVASNYSGASGHSHQDTGYNSTDDLLPRDNLSPLRSLSRENSPVHDILEENDENTSQHLKESLQALEADIVRRDGNKTENASHRESCASTSTVKSDHEGDLPLEDYEECLSDNDKRKVAALPDDSSNILPGEDNDLRMSGKTEMHDSTVKLNNTPVNCITSRRLQHSGALLVSLNQTDLCVVSLGKNLYWT